MIRKIGDVRCITIVHPLDEIRKYRECSAFFRLLGIFVCENICGKEYGDPTDYRISFSVDDDWNAAISPVTVINDMVADDVISPSMGSLFQNLYTIFDTNDLMRASYATAYFFNANNSYIYAQMYEYYNRFDKAYSAFEKLEKSVNDPDELKYIWAAKSNCKRRMNELYTHIWNAIEKGWYTKDKKEKNQLKQKLWDRHFFDYEEINVDIQKILDVEPDFYGAYAIRGFALELDREHRFDSVADLINAVNCIGEKSYASYVCYRIGKYYESIRGNLSRKWEYYQKSWKLDPNNYRALHKLILREKAAGNLDKADEYCKKLVEILHDKKRSPALQPIECAYLYKTYSLWGDIHMKKAENAHEISGIIQKSELRYSIACNQKAEEIYEMTANEDKVKGFYPWMFGTGLVDPKNLTVRWMVFKKAAKDKLVIKSLYRRLANAAADAGMKEIYEIYYPLSLEDTEDKAR